MKLNIRFRGLCLCALLSAAAPSAYAKDVAFYYAPGLVIGPATFKNHPTSIGIRSSIAFAETVNFPICLSGGYSYYHYRSSLPYYSWLTAVENIYTFVWGASIKYPF